MEIKPSLSIKKRDCLKKQDSHSANNLCEKLNYLSFNPNLLTHQRYIELLNIIVLSQTPELAQYHPSTPIAQFLHQPIARSPTLQNDNLVEVLL